MEEGIQTGKVVVKEHDTYELASSAAFSEASNTGGWTFPVVLFRQGKRLYLSGAFPIGFVESRLFSNSAKRESNIKAAMGTMNRPEDPKHIKTIAKYLKDNSGNNFIIPPLTLNAQQEVRVHTLDIPSEFKAGYLVIPLGTNLSITDGQHRVKGIIQALKELDDDTAEKLRKYSVSVMVTCESDLKQIHQDFADCSKTKALPASLLSLYDTRNPGNRLVFDIEAKCPLFTGKIDSTSKTLSTKSSYLFLANQIRQLVKHLLLQGNTPDADFEKRANDLITTKGYENYLMNYVEYINYVTEKIPVLKQISMISVDTPERAQILRLRNEGWVCLTATGLNLIGSLGHQFFTNKVENWKEYVDKFSEVDWKKTGPLWQGNIIIDGRMNTQTSPVRKAVAALKAAIGYDQTE